MYAAPMQYTSSLFAPLPLYSLYTHNDILGPANRQDGPARNRFAAADY